MKRLSIILIAFTATWFEACKKDNRDSNNVSLNGIKFTIDTVFQITSTSARVEAVISDDGGHVITASGICYGTTPIPTTSNSLIASSTTLGVIEDTITGLTLSTTYYERAFATNDLGTVYSAEKSFTTLGNAVLESVQIGTQVWAKKNLDVTNYKNGDPIPRVEENVIWAGLNSGACCYFQNQSSYVPVYGVLYNWYAVSDPRGLAPQGWHIPTDAEWTTLSDFLGGASDAGAKMKEAGLEHWITPNTGATNTSNFTALPGSSRSGGFDGAFTSSLGSFGGWWSSTMPASQPLFRYLVNNNDELFANPSNPQGGFSIRCVKD